MELTKQELSIIAYVEHIENQNEYLNTMVEELKKENKDLVKVELTKSELEALVYVQNLNIEINSLKCEISDLERDKELLKLLCSIRKQKNKEE